MSGVNKIIELNHRALGRALDRYLDIVGAPGAALNVLLISPHFDDWAFVNGKLPHATFYVSTQSTWDLNETLASPFDFDLIIASNVFCCSPDPNRWFENVFMRTRFLLIQDMIYRKRSGDYPYLGADNDKIRFRFLNRQIDSEFEGAFDLSQLEDVIVYFEEFAGAENEWHRGPKSLPKHFVMLARGHGKGHGNKWHMCFSRFGLNALRFKYPTLLFPLRLGYHLYKKLGC